MTANPFLPYALSICGIPELDQFAGRVSHVVSILDPAWPEPRAFGNFGDHRRETFRFDDVVRPKDGMAMPAENHVARLLEIGRALKDAESRAEHLLIHCHAGISRSTAAAVILMAEDHPGREAEIFAHLARIRPRSWPNSRMIGIADDLLGRGGKLSAALSVHHAKVAMDMPDLADLIRVHGRAHEVPDGN